LTGLGATKNASVLLLCFALFSCFLPSILTTAARA
jgi:hypothetical protein